MKELQELAARLLSDGEVKVVIGWEEGPTGARPAFVTDPGDTGRLIFDERCVHCLPAYLSPRRKHIVRLGKSAIVVKPCDARAAAGLLRENQVKREDVILIGVRCGGVKADPGDNGPLTEENVSVRCSGCEAREPRLADYLVGEEKHAPPADPKKAESIAALEAMSHAERWAFWQEQFARCVRCNACREVCPLCTCERCVADKTMPQWIDSSAHPAAIFAWQLTRAQHHAGRCAACGECARVCPADIPLGLLNREVARIVERRFGYKLNDDPEAPEPLGVFSSQDPQEFIR